MIKSLALAAIALGTVATTAAEAAVVVSYTPLRVGSFMGETIVRDSEGPNGAVGITGSRFGLYTGTRAGTAAAPFGNGSQYLAVLSGGSATISFDNAVSEFSIDLGSVDSFNRLAINLVGGGQAVFTGAQLTGFQPADGNQTVGQTNGRARFTGTAGELFTSIVLTSSGNSFEVDNIAVAAVPEPATWAMMIGGFGLVGSAMRRRRETGKTVLA